MPGLVACGRSWEFGSDDLVFPALVLVGVRLVWLVCQVVAFIVFIGAITCTQVYFVSVCVTLFLTVLLLVVESAIMFVGSRGSIRNSRPRRFMTSLLHFRFLLFMLEVIVLVVKTVLVAQPFSDQDRERCPDLDTAVIYTEVVVILTWVLLALFILAVVIFLDPCHCYSAKANFDQLDEFRDSDLATRWVLTRSVWEKRFRVVCCFAGSDDAHQVAYREVAEIFAHWFCDSRLVLSDIAAALVLLQKEEIQRELARLESEDEPDAVQSVPLDFSNPDERQAFQDALHFLSFALGIYTWPIFLYMNPLCGCCQLAKHLTCGVLPHIEEDHCFNCGFAAAVSMTGINKVDVVYACFKNDLYRAPFMVCIDHKTQSVVITIRGTLSMHDIITDLCASTIQVTFADLPQLRVHKGMHTSALHIVQELENGILEDAFRKVPSYTKLVVVGHSLGSGVSCLVAIMLRERYPELRCFCYSPTGSLFTEEGVTYTESFVTSVILGYDLVSRLSINTAHVLKDDIHRVLRGSSKPKYRILLEGGLETLCKCCGKMVVLDKQCDRQNSEQNESLSPLIVSPSVSFTTNASRDEECEMLPNRAIPLYPPGKIIHLMDTEQDRGCCFGRRSLEARWVSSDSFQRISVVPEMVRDHFPDVILDAMKAVWASKESVPVNI